MPRLRVDEAETLQVFLFARLEDWKRNTIKRHLKGGAVRVNGSAVTRHDHLLAAGDEVQVGDATPQASARTTTKGLDILHMDDAVVAIDKPSGLLSVSTPRETRRTAMARLQDQLRASKGAGAARLWAVHRLDRETSGVLLFARSERARKALVQAWHGVHKTYVAVVHGVLKAEAGCIDRPLLESKKLDVILAPVGCEDPAMRDAITRYRVLGAGRSRSLVELDIETGRKHQIRVHMASLGHPIVGDTRYGGEPWRSRIALHAAKLVFAHPCSGDVTTVESPVPEPFVQLVPRPRRLFESDAQDP